jgi:8-oxo-dGTP diphosphatase
MSAVTVAAAGGVVWRPGERTKPEVALVHRPRYDDWTLPKGKLRAGESPLAAAVREVGEELGAAVAVGRRLTRVRYPLGAGRKEVSYWAMRYLGGAFSPGEEVDEVVWLTPGKARKQVTYDVDRAVLADFAATPVPDSVIVLVRHAKAGKRSDWHGADYERPLEPAGEQQATALVEFLSCFRPDRIYSARPVRCVQTVRPLADAADLSVQIAPEFDDEEFVRAPAATQTALLALAKPGRVSVVCSQGVTVPALIDAVAPMNRSSETRKGAAWVLSLVDGDVVAADHYDAPR